MQRFIAFTFALLITQTSHAQLIIAHRGASHDAPENTLAAFKLAWEQNADGIEGDFRLTKDGHIICIHDSTTKRTTRANLNVSQSTLAELRKLDAGSWKNKRWKDERLPTLDEVLAVVPDGKQLFIEIKCGPEIVPALKRALSDSKLKPEQTPIISFNASVIAACRKELTDRQAHWLTSYKHDKKTKQWSPTIESVLQTLKRTNASGLDTNAHRAIDDAFVKSLRDAGMAFHCWTIDDARTAKRFQKLGVDSITTNKPRVLRDALSK